MAKTNKLQRPKNTKLPYFAYDSFKPWEIAFPLIEYFVDDIEETSAEYPIGTRNGVPALLDNKNEWGKTNGFIIRFNGNTVSKYYGKTNAMILSEAQKTKIYTNGEPLNLKMEKKLMRYLV